MEMRGAHIIHFDGHFTYLFSSSNILLRVTLARTDHESKLDEKTRSTPEKTNEIDGTILRPQNVKVTLSDLLE